ncbi:MAG: hypothetical protein KME22_00635 [Hassallia sp. WJT32-NPBG1]|nr:hypothetical protein [Hassallia sp. WJT32-NPBG1]
MFVTYFHLLGSHPRTPRLFLQLLGDSNDCDRTLDRDKRCHTKGIYVSYEKAGFEKTSFVHN